MINEKHTYLSNLYQYINSPSVREAFVYLIEHSKKIQHIQCRPAPHGYIQNNYHYYIKGVSRYAFTINKKWLLFYIQKVHETNPYLTIEILKENITNINIRKDGEINFKIFNISQAKNAMKLLFGFV